MEGLFNKLLKKMPETEEAVVDPKDQECFLFFFFKFVEGVEWPLTTGEEMKSVLEKGERCIFKRIKRLFAGYKRSFLPHSLPPPIYEF